jgi:hypothetical protein
VSRVPAVELAVEVVVGKGIRPSVPGVPVPFWPLVSVVDVGIGRRTKASQQELSFATQETRSVSRGKIG